MSRGRRRPRRRGPAEPVLAPLEEAARRLGRRIASDLPRGAGFALLIFNVGEAGAGAGERFLTYISNAQRADMLDALEEFLERQGRPRPPRA